MARGDSVTVTWRARASGRYTVWLGGTYCGDGTKAAAGSYAAPARRTLTVELRAPLPPRGWVRVCLRAASGTLSDAVRVSASPAGEPLGTPGARDRVALVSVAALALAAVLLGGVLPMVAGRRRRSEPRGTPLVSRAVLRQSAVRLRHLSPRSAATVLAAAMAAVAIVAAFLVTSLAGRDLLVASLCCIGTCVVLAAYEVVRTRDVLNGAVLLLVPVLLGFGARGLSLVADGGQLKFPRWVDLSTRDALATRALWTATAGTLALYVGYRIGTGLAARVRRGTPLEIDARRRKQAIVVLAAVGVLSYIVLIVALGGATYFRTIVYARQETGGLGTLKLLENGARLAAFLWMVTTPRLSGRRVLVVIVALLFLTTGQRSEVFAVVIPALVIYHYRVRFVRLPVAAAAVLFLTAVSIAFVEYRHYTREQAVTQRDVGGATIVRPAPPQGSASPFSTGLVSLDGLVLAQYAVPADRSPTWGRDLNRVVYGFVPRQVWPAKPGSPADELTNRYVRARGGGIFVSGFGTLWTMGMLPAVVLGSLLIGLGVGWLSTRARIARSVGWLLIYAVSAPTIVRWSLAGDTNTLFFYLQILVPALVVVYFISARRAGSLASAPTRDALPARG